jgi:uncharacterized surface protein with fasciclin (FAS1) repeats
MLDNVRDSTFTMFAPSKEAFRQLAHQTNGHYLDRSSHDALLDLVASHILPGVITVDHIPAHGLKVHIPPARHQRPPSATQRVSDFLTQVHVLCADGVHHRP